MLVTTLFASALNAQQASPLFRGNFTVPYEVRWGKATLPAGDYSFLVSSANPRHRVTVRGEKQSWIIVPAGTSACRSCEDSTLIVRPGEERPTIFALRLAKVGADRSGLHIYFGSRKAGEEAVRASRDVQRIQVLLATE
jgi:hypothetical protein